MKNIYPNTASCLHYSHDARGRTEHAIKRLTDIVCAALGLVLLSPVFIVIAVLLKCQRGGNVFFSQERIGLGGKPFNIYKFRTMSSVVEDEGPRLISEPDITQSWLVRALSVFISLRKSWSIRMIMS